MPVALVTYAVPTLPGWLHGVETFTPTRTFALAVGLLLLNPVDLGCVIGGAVELARSSVTSGWPAVAGLLFVLVAGSSVIVPVGVLLIRGHDADPLLRALRTWIAGHNGLVNALILVVTGVLQASKAIQAL